ncbi:hypothetical protein C8Q74DRAFT_1193664 [Fomes fomentarius]|nr:hypothetical protein C8Q74DRAFT_1193664 [Fomes fomentarius]
MYAQVINAFVHTGPITKVHWQAGKKTKHIHWIMFALNRSQWEHVHLGIKILKVCVQLSSSMPYVKPIYFTFHNANKYHQICLSMMKLTLRQVIPTFETLCLLR